MQKQSSTLVRLIGAALSVVGLVLLVSCAGTEPVGATAAPPTATPSAWVYLPVVSRGL